MRYIFIVGVGRSGTSLLQSMLANRDDVCALPETGILRRFVFNADSYHGSLSDDSQASRFTLFQQVLRQNVGVLDGKAILRCFTDAGEQESQGLPYILDKDPRLVESIDLLNRYFRDCRIVHIYRDPRDVLASKKKAAWSTGRSLFSYLLASCVQLQDGFKNAEAGLVSVKYEELIADTENTLRNLCASVDIAYKDTMLRHYESARMLVHKDEMDWKKETLSQVKRDNSDKWKNELTDFEALASEWAGHRAMRHGAYVSHYKKCSWTTIVAAWLSVQLICIGACVYRGVRLFNRWRVRRSLGKN